MRISDWSSDVCSSDLSVAAHVAARAQVGNVYVNRNQIGAIVGSQPFGGRGLSGTGPKAGGPHYLHRFAEEKSISTDIPAAGGNAALLAGRKADERSDGQASAAPKRPALAWTEVPGAE